MCGMTTAMRFMCALAVLSCVVACSGEQPTVATPPLPSASASAPSTSPSASASAAALPTPIADRYRPIAKKIIAAALASDGAWKKLQHMTDHIGHRLTGSAQLAQAIDWAIATMKAEGHENVRKEPAMIPHWVRGEQKVELSAPIKRQLHALT